MFVHKHVNLITRVNKIEACNGFTIYAMYERWRLKVKVECRSLQIFVYEQPFIQCLYLIYARKIYVRMHVTIARPRKFAFKEFLWCHVGPWAHCYTSRAIHIFTAYTRYRLACVASISGGFQSKEWGTGVKDRAKNGASKRTGRNRTRLRAKKCLFKSNKRALN